MNEDSKTTVIKTYNQLAFQLFHQLRQECPSRNIVFSPFSITTTLVLCLNGANGKTRDEFNQLLHFPSLSLTQINEANQILMNMLNDVNFTGLDIELQNILKITDVSSLRKSFKYQAEEQYQTQISSPAEGSAFANLINKIHFSGQWFEGFNATETSKKLFFTSHLRATRVNMMRSTDQFRPYYKTNNTEIIQLPYRIPNTNGIGAFAMTIAKPKRIKQFLGELDNHTWERYIEGLDDNKGDLWLPRFTINMQSSLVPILKHLGISTAFSDEFADFSNMVTKCVFIGKYDHHAEVSVDEHGTVGTSETKVTFYSYGIRPKPHFQMKVNRPFFFTIEDTLSGLILYMSLVHNPNHKGV